MKSAPTPLDPLSVVEQLDADALLAEVAELTRRRAAVIVLLRAARARDRAAQRRLKPAPAPEGGAHAG